MHFWSLNTLEKPSPGLCTLPSKSQLPSVSMGVYKRKKKKTNLGGGWFFKIIIIIIFALLVIISAFETSLGIFC